MIIYYSKLGKTKKFISKISNGIYINNNLPSNVNNSYILITPTYGSGQVPEEVIEFVNNTRENIRGVIASGNKNFGSNYAKAGNIISNKYNVPLIHTIEMTGTEEDAKIAEKAVEDYCRNILN